MTSAELENTPNLLKCECAGGQADDDDDDKGRTLSLISRCLPVQSLRLIDGQWSATLRATPDRTTDKRTDARRHIDLCACSLPDSGACGAQWSSLRDHVLPRARVSMYVQYVDCRETRALCTFCF